MSVTMCTGERLVASRDASCWLQLQFVKSDEVDKQLLSVDG